MLRAILFDFGDTLIDFEPMDSRAVFHESARLTYDFLQRHGARLSSFNQYRRMQFASVQWSYLWAKLRGRDFNSLQLLNRFCITSGLTLSPADLHELAWLWYSPLLRHCSMEATLPATLRDLHDRGYKLGVISNTFVPGTVLDRHLELHGLCDLFETRIYSSEVGYRKPDRRIFTRAMESLGITSRESLFVGDLVKTDIVGAQRAGMRTALKRPWGDVRGRHNADYVIRQVADLIDIIKRLPSRPMSFDPQSSMLASGMECAPSM